jgi:hypothetical protein
MLKDLDWGALTMAEELEGPDSTPSRLRSLFRVEGFDLPIEGFPTLEDLDSLEPGLCRAVSRLEPGSRLGDWVGRGFSLADVLLVNPSRARRSQVSRGDLGTGFVHRSLSFGIDFSMVFHGSDLDLEIEDPRSYEFRLGPQRPGDELCQAAYALFGPRVGAAATLREGAQKLASLGIAEYLIEPTCALLVRDTFVALTQDQGLRNRIRRAYAAEERAIGRSLLRLVYRPDVQARKGW